jgi:glycosyltransferase involved in cell wall biosynthesis
MRPSLNHPDTHRLNVCFVGGVRYSQPLDATTVKKFKMLASVGNIFIVGFSTTLAPRRFAEHARFYLLPLLPFPILRYFQLFTVGMGVVFWMILRHQVRVLVATSPYEAIPCVITKIIAGWFGCKIVLILESHGDFEESLFMQRRIVFPALYKAIMQGVARWTIDNADVLRAVSDSTRQQLTRWKPGAQVVQFFTWTDLEVFQNVGQERQDDFSPTFLYAGVIIPRKGVIHLVNAFATLAADFSQARLILIGKEDNPAYAAEVKARVRQYGCDTQVQFLTSLPQQQLAEYMRQVGVFVLPTYSEGLPRVVFEAMSAGLPIISTPVSGIPEIVQEGVTGFLIRPGDETALAAKMRWCLEHPDVVKAIGRAAYAFARATFSTEKYLDGYCRMFETARSLNYANHAS